MITFLLNLILTPFIPQMTDPQERYSSELSVIVRELERDNLKVPSVSVKPPEASSPEEVEHPPPIAMTSPINGRLLSNLMTSHAGNPTGDAESDAIEAQVKQLVLTGILKVGNDRVAVINDGEKDLVVSRGSYIRDSMRVVKVNQSSVSLKRLGIKGKEKLLELHLKLNDAPGDVE